MQPTQPFSTSEDSGPPPQAFRQVEGGSRLERPPLKRKGSHPAPRASIKRKGTLRRQKVAEAGAEDFISWIPPISRRSSDLEEEEEEDEMYGLIQNFVARKLKRDANLEQAADALLEVVGGSG